MQKILTLRCQKKTPGLEAVFAITGLLVVTYLVKCKKS
ncbi:MAG: hypothetical protein K8R34_17220 [Methanosarcinales archaeon]|nr:hypothetical protein [Methanosarcinales archaeon]